MKLHTIKPQQVHVHMHRVIVTTAFNKTRQDAETYNARTMVVHSNVFNRPPLYLPSKNPYWYSLYLHLLNNAL